ncbi:STE3-domain-containing protein [Peniophora sp. CONT]|nr:STE3-domain-containing protein [Peniophora sp. CONT]
MGAVDPTFPLFPVASILASISLLLVLLSSVVRRSWNLGVTFLCFWLFLENLAHFISAIAWSHNADVKLYAYCDIVSRLQVFCSVVKPMSTVIITRRLYLITRYLSGEAPDKTKRRRDYAVEWTLGLAVPILIAGPLYYIVQDTRFIVIAGFGCTSSTTDSILTLLVIQIWFMIPPLLSITFYYPNMIWVLYRQSRALNRFLDSDDSDVTRTNYFRILALASIDLLLTLPLSITRFVLAVLSIMKATSLPFYPGWESVHSDWTPVSISWAKLNSKGVPELAFVHYSFWISPIFALAFFGLFGFTAGARASYWRVIHTVIARLGWKKASFSQDSQATLTPIQFGAPTHELSFDTAELASRPSFISVPAPPGLRAATKVYNIFRQDEASEESLDMNGKDYIGYGPCREPVKPVSLQ